MTLAITPLYAGLIGVLFVILSLRVSKRRISAKVTSGDGDDKALFKRIRVQANCAEYAPIGLLLLAMAELQGAPVWVVHLLGLMLLAGRIMHAVGFGSTPQIVPLRRIGMMITYLMLLLASLANIGHALI
jgi:uncharacterized membrane protein YecN with MAPEG domain